jgi:hypothetical protein
MSSMTLSQALRRIKKIKGDLAENLARSLPSVTWKVGDDPAFNFNTLVEDSNKLRLELCRLKAAVAVTNATTFEMDGDRKISLAEAVVILSEMKAELKHLEDLKIYVRNQKLVSDEERTWDDFANKHITKKVQWQCALPEAERVARVNEVKARFEALNDAVESANHRTVLKTSGQVGEQGK